MQYKEIKINNLVYLISSDGEVYRKMKPFNNKGYKKVSLGGRDNKEYFVHRLVAECFIPNPDNLPIINHKDENPSNNCADNLEWCDQKYNINYGTQKERAAISRSKPVVQCDKETHQPIQYFLSATKASEQFPIPENARKRIVEVCKDSKDVRYHSAYGYWWRFATLEESQEIKTRSTS